MGGKCPKSKSDIIVESVEANSFEDLDHTKTDLLKPKSSAGWLSPDGKFYGCSWAQHDLLAVLVLKTPVGDLEKRGWMRIHSHYEIDCLRFPTDAQLSWASSNGYFVEVSHVSQLDS